MPDKNQRKSKEEEKMDNYFSVPIFKSDEGEAFYDALSQQLGKPQEMVSIAVLSTVKLLTTLPEPVSNAIISPLAALPLLINHEDALVRSIVKTRLQANV